MGTFDGLLIEEVMHNRLNKRRCRLVLCLGLVNHLRQILQNQPARNVGPFASELSKIMANTTADIDKQDIIRADVQSLRQRRDGEESLVHPAGTALVVRRHVVIELLRMDRVLLKVFEEVGGGAVSVLEGGFDAVAGVDVVGFLEVGGEGYDAACDAASPESVSLFQVVRWREVRHTCMDRHRYTA